jgi:MaoC like domain/short chain dehydrogenase
VTTTGGAEPTVRRCVTAVDAAAQDAFVALSGDANPLHTDPLAARRLPFGRLAVHGVHLALLALDAWGATTGSTPGRVRATLRHPVGVGDDVALSVDGETVRLTVDARLVADVRIDAGSAPTAALEPLGPIGTPANRSIGELASCAGPLPLAGDGEAMAARFPHVPVAVTATLLAMTRLVGMEVPGLHSMLSSFDVTFGGEPVGAARFGVTDVDDRFSKVTISITGEGANGTVVAFVRPEPADQLVDIGDVAPGEFGGVRALVVGGSRGLGAAAVQLLAAGGADVRFTYHRGADDAARVAASAPGSAAHPFDVADTAQLDALMSDGWHPTLLAWFASPPIFVGARDVYVPALFERFRAVYVDDFVRAVDRLDPRRLDGVLWPSSEAVHGVPRMAEYADAKRAGEAACDALRDRHPHLRVHAPRFPRLRTDQTASFVPVDHDEPAPHVLSALRELLGGQPG